MNRIRTMCLLSFSLALGCTAPEPLSLEGTYVGTDDVGGNYNVMLIEADDTGAMIVYFYFDDPNVVYERFFTVECARDTRFDFVCDASCACTDGECETCSELDFTMSCSEASYGFTCEGDGIWRDYVFEWEYFATTE